MNMYTHISFAGFQQYTQTKGEGEPELHGHR